MAVHWSMQFERLVAATDPRGVPALVVRHSTTYELDPLVTVVPSDAGHMGPAEAVGELVDNELELELETETEMETELEPEPELEPKPELELELERGKVLEETLDELIITAVDFRTLHASGLATSGPRGPATNVQVPNSGA